MKVILVRDVNGLGRAGDIKEVSDGHARNFLIPKHLVLPATTETLVRVQKEESEHISKIAKEKERIAELKTKLENKTFTIKAKANKLNLFAAIHEQDIAKVINQKMGAEINPKLIIIEHPLKTLGLHQVQIRLGQNQTANVKLNVETV